MNTLTATMALLMGFTGSLHCAGMCGPLVWIMPFQAFTGYKKIAALGLYHLGRISVYACFAVILHSFRSLFDPRAQQVISIILGCSLLLAGILSFMPNQIIRLKLPWVEFVQKQLGFTMGKPGLPAMAIAGLLNGLLPCGLVYMALSATLTTATAWQAASMMYIFGLGTLPMLVSISLLKNKLTFFRTAHIRRLVPVVVFSFGCLLILRGLNLDIPYLSPKVTVTQHEIKSCCAHKK
jgi:sulfite exporter TauE/SafE